MTKRRMRFPDGTILVYNDEIWLVEPLSRLAGGEQRCQRHVHRDLYHMIWMDEGKVGDVKPMQRRLRGIMAIKLPREPFTQVHWSGNGR